MLTKLDPKIQNRLGISINEISAFCQQWNIAEMALFGSILREDFQTDSDLDFLITFLPNARQGLLTLAKIKHQLESLTNRPVDITLKDSIKTSENWIRRSEILTTAQTVYEQR
jgi:predicted nucleotidyltransferase